MNIFVLDEDPIKCAEYHCNKHVVKMILETAQLLCGVHHMTKLEGQMEEIPYKLSHKNHPCSIWARECIENYVWLCDLGMALCKEYTYRYGKKHKSQQVIEWCMINLPDLEERGKLTPFALAMPDDCKICEFIHCKTCTIESYRKYYMVHKKDICEWKLRNKPEWFII